MVLSCNYCGSPKPDDITVTLTIHDDRFQVEVYVCPACAAKNTIGDLIVQGGLAINAERKRLGLEGVKG